MTQIRLGWRSGAGPSINYLLSSISSLNTPLLDTYTEASAAYSLRKLKTDYSGHAIRVRRSSDNTEQNIGFNGSGNLDTTTLLSFVGSGNGFVTTWYDQSGAAKNATQTTAANQPQIVSSGVVHLKNGKPSIYFSGNQMMVTTANVVSTGNQPYSIYGVSHNVGISSSTLFYIGSGSGNNGIGLQVISGGSLRHFWYTSESASYASTINNQYYYSIEFTGSNVFTSRNDSTTLNATGRTKNTLSPTLMIGKMVNWNEWYNGYHQELIIFDNYNTNEVSTGIRVNINTYYSSYTQDANPLTAAAYSLRKLRSDYTGNAIRVRRLSDNAETNIGFVNGNLDEATLSTFAGSNNKFLYSEEFDNAIWSKGGVSITANQGIAPDGTQTADLLQETAGNGQHYLSRTGIDVGFGVNSSWNMSFYIKKASNNTATSNKIMMLQHKTDYSDGGTKAVFNLDSGQVVYTAEGNVGGGTFGLLGATMSNEGNGWWRCSMYGKRPVAVYGTQNAEVSIAIGKVPATDNWGNVINNVPGYNITWNGDTNGKYLIWGVQMTFKNNDTSYQTIKTYTKATNTFPGYAYVTTWYDQSGNGRNLTQATAVNQPPVIEDGTVVKLNSKPVLSFMFASLSRRWLGMTWGTMTMNPPFSMFANIKLQTSVYDFNIISGLENNKRFGISSFSVGNWTPSYTFWASDNNYIGGNVANTNNSIHFVYTSVSENTLIGLNGTSTAKYITPTAWRAIQIGTFDSGQFYCSEVIFFYGDKTGTRSVVESDINSYYSVY
jgi:hypothetical protein